MRHVLDGDEQRLAQASGLLGTVRRMAIVKEHAPASKSEC